MSLLLHRSVLPSPWRTSRASPSCSWAPGRPTTTCAASTPAPWSAPWWRLKWLHVLLFIHHRKQKPTLPFATLPWDVPALLACISHPPVLPCPSLLCIKWRTHVMHRTWFPRWRTSVHFERQIMFATQPEEPPCASFLNLLGQIEKSTSDLPEFWNKWHFSWLNGSEAVNVICLLVYTVNTYKTNSPPGILSVSFPLFM